MVVQWAIVLGRLAQQVLKTICQLLTVTYSDLLNTTAAVYFPEGYPILTQKDFIFPSQIQKQLLHPPYGMLVHTQLHGDGCHPHWPAHLNLPVHWVSSPPFFSTSMKKGLQKSSIPMWTFYLESVFPPFPVYIFLSYTPSSITYGQ